MVNEIVATCGLDALVGIASEELENRSRIPSVKTKLQPEISGVPSMGLTSLCTDPAYETSSDLITAVDVSHPVCMHEGPSTYLIRLAQTVSPSEPLGQPSSSCAPQISIQTRRFRVEPTRYMKNEEDIELCEELIMTNFPTIQALYLDCLARSKKYPEIDLKTI